MTVKFEMVSLAFECHSEQTPLQTVYIRHQSTVDYSAKIMSKLSRKKLSREENLSLPRELVEGWGYEFESHEVITEDGYILNVHR